MNSYDDLSCEEKTQLHLQKVSCIESALADNARATKKACFDYKMCKLASDAVHKNTSLFEDVLDVVDYDAEIAHMTLKDLKKEFRQLKRQLHSEMRFRC
jgi:ribosomal protein L29